MSLINNSSQHIKFVSYTGAYPNLCRGILILEIDGVKYKFGRQHGAYDIPPALVLGVRNGEIFYPRFWQTGGMCSQGCASQGEWVIDAGLLPDFLKTYAYEIDKVFNENVEHGCCGGCV